MAKNSFDKYLRILSSANANVAERVGTGRKNSYYTQQDAMNLDISAQVINGCLIFTTKGRFVSLNFVVSKQSWADKYELKDIVIKKVREAVSGINISIERYKKVLFYNSRMDDDNTIMMSKWFTDAIKTEKQKNSDGFLLQDDEGKQLYNYVGLIPEDSKKHSAGTYLIPDDSLNHNTYVFMYIPVDHFDKDSLLEYRKNVI